MASSLCPRWRRCPTSNSSNSMTRDFSRDSLQAMDHGNREAAAYPTKERSRPLLVIWTDRLDRWLAVTDKIVSRGPHTRLWETCIISKIQVTLTRSLLGCFMRADDKYSSFLARATGQEHRLFQVTSTVHIIAFTNFPAPSSWVYSQNHPSPPMEGRSGRHHGR
jgi:hypothetical protein